MKKIIVIILLLTSVVCLGDIFTSHLKPTSNNTLDVGTTSLLWRHIYGVDGTFSGTVTAETFDTISANITTTGTITAGTFTDGTFIVSGGIISAGTWHGDTITVPYGGTGAITLTDGGLLVGSGTSAITVLSVLADGSIIVGDGVTDPVALTAFTSSTGDLKHEAGGLEFDASAVVDSDFIVGTGAGSMGLESGNTARTSLGVSIGSDVQAYSAALDDLHNAGIVTGDGYFLVGTGAGVSVWEAAATAKTSIGLGNVENTQLSTWAGTTNITTLGTISTVGNITIANGGTIGQAAGPLLTFNDTANTLEITGCKVGVGVTPLGTLEIYEALGSPSDLGNFEEYQLVVGGGAGTGNTAGILLHTTTDTYGGSAIVHYDTDTGGKGDLVFYTKQGTTAIPPVEVMRLDDAGNVDVINDFTAGTIQADNGVSGTLVLDDGSTERITLVFTGGILTSRTVAVTVALLIDWTD